MKTKYMTIKKANSILGDEDSSQEEIKEAKRFLINLQLSSTTTSKSSKLPCRVCDEDEPRITEFRCGVCGAAVCEEHRTSQHCEDCYP